MLCESKYFTRSFLEDEISFWLDMGNYSDFIVYFDEHYIYQAIVTSPPKFTGTRKSGVLIPFEFTVSIRPLRKIVLANIG